MNATYPFGVPALAGSDRLKAGLQARAERNAREDSCVGAHLEQAR